ncbi:TetR/AcrR family transcriptional regulator [Catenulispora yoronensis]|uniref:TetR/AcrR family transcriptional regulator n=1 Tax=Catenulispora yoronensis TaxID=450799 RepID=A0ABP5H065_9ACTN
MPEKERADAARNRARVLAAAEELFAAGDPGAVTMDDIAKAAGVGRGTLYRRYPDRASIAQALLDEHERVIQERILRGPGPLGPEPASSGPAATPAERLAAFYEAQVELLERHVHLYLGAEVGAARYATGAYAFWRQHVRLLASAAGIADPDTAADLLLAPLAPDLYRRQRDIGVTPERYVRALSALAGKYLG